MEGMCPWGTGGLHWGVRTSGPGTQGGQCFAPPHRGSCEPQNLVEWKLPRLRQSPSILYPVPFTTTNMLACCAKKEWVWLRYLLETGRPLTPNEKARLYLLLLDQCFEILQGGHDVLVHFVHNAWFLGKESGCSKTLLKKREGSEAQGSGTLRS